MNGLPRGIHLPAVGETWSVEYRASVASVTSCRQRNGRLILSGDVVDSSACREALRRWLKRRTHATLVPMLFELAADNALVAPKRVRVALQRSRWGSCSARETISLNACLLFLPDWLTRSVLLHELCHLEHLNHSPDFYALLGRADPDFRRARTSLRNAWQHVPAWTNDGARPLPVGPLEVQGSVRVRSTR